MLVLVGWGWVLAFDGAYTAGYQCEQGTLTGHWYLRVGVVLY
jgi:hypothetical protein